MKKTSNRSPQPHYSPVKFIKEAQTIFKPDFSSTLFVPFAHERDGLGRLIKAPKKEQIQNNLKKKISQGSDCVLVNNCTSETCVSLTDKVNMIQDIITSSFQYKHSCQVKLYESNKIQIHKKTLLPIPSNKSTRKYSGQDLFMTNNNEGQTRRARFLSSDLTLQTKNEQNALIRFQSLPKIIRPNNSKFREESKSNKDSTQEKTSEKSKRQQSMASSTSKLQKIKPLKKKLNQSPTQKILIPLAAKIQNDGTPLNLQSYRRWPKLNSQIEKSNQIFLSKIRQSKKLAYKIRVTLQAQQWDQQ